MKILVPLHSTDLLLRHRELHFLAPPYYLTVAL